MEQTPNFHADVYENEWDRIVVFDQMCKSCGLCIVECPTDCLFWSEEKLGVYGTPVPECVIDDCISCKLCEVICPDAAIYYEKLKAKPKELKVKPKKKVETAV